MIEPRQILFRAKPKDWKTNKKDNVWLEGYYLKKQDTTYCFKEDYENYPVETRHYIAVEQMTDWGLPNEFRLLEIDPDTLCEFIGWNDNHKTKIFENDVVEMICGKTSEKYLIWWNKEMSMMTAVPLDEIECNGSDYYNYKYHKFNYLEFCLMLQDQWGDFSDVKVIGNIIDNPELIKEKLNE